MLQRAVLFALLSLPLAAGAASGQNIDSELESLLRQAHEIDLRFQQVARSIPLFDQGAATAYVESAARPLAIDGFEARPAAIQRRLTDSRGEATAVELHAIDVSGTAEFGEIRMFLRTLRNGTVLARPESLRIIAGPGGPSSFTARISIPSLTEESFVDSSLEDDVEDALRRKLARDEARLDAVLEFVESIETDRRLEALTRFANEISTDRIALFDVTFHGRDRIDMTGIAAGERARSSLEEDLDTAGFIGRRSEFTGENGCRTFAISASVRQGAAGDADPPLSDPFDHGARERCAVQPEPRLRSIRAGTDDGSPLIAFRAVDLVDLFYALNDLFLMNFVIDESVVGSVDLEVFSDAGVEEMLTALRSVAHIGEGPLRRVSLSSTARPADLNGTGEPVNLSFRRALVRDLLCLAQSIGGGEMRMPEGSAARVSVFAENVPLDDLVGALTTSAGFPSQQSLSGANGQPVCGPQDSAQARTARIDPLAMAVHEIGPSDLELAGVALLGAVQHAYVYTPGRVLRRIEAGDELFGARVAEVSLSGVRIATGDGEITLRAAE